MPSFTFECTYFSFQDFKINNCYYRKLCGWLNLIRITSSHKGYLSTQKQNIFNGSCSIYRERKTRFLFLFDDIPSELKRAQD